MILGITTYDEVRFDVRAKICTCSGPSIWGLKPKKDPYTKVCLSCGKPPITVAYTCGECLDVFIRHGLSFFRHPNFCPLHPRCWECLSALPGEVYVECCTGRREHHPFYCDSLTMPPKKKKAVLKEGFSLFDKYY